MLDFVNPQRAGRWPGHLRRLARLDEAGGTAHDVSVVVPRVEATVLWLSPIAIAVIVLFM
jgi:hypothetical protein